MQLTSVQKWIIRAADCYDTTINATMKQLVYRTLDWTSCEQRQRRSSMTILGMRRPRLQTCSVARSNASSPRTRQSPNNQGRSGRSAKRLQADSLDAG